MNIKLRLETPADHRAVEELTREAFWGFSSPTCDEHYLLHLLRSAEAFVPELDYVAEIDGKLVGNVMYSKAKIVRADLRVCPNSGMHEVLTFGPLSVLPEYWNCGVGSALMRHTIIEAKRLGYKGIVFYGHPDYYPRFGFRNAGAFGITTPDGKNYDSLMAMPLYEDAFEGISGAFYEDPVFSICGKDKEGLERFNMQLPDKEPASMIPISVLLDRLEPMAQKEFTGRDITVLAWLNRFSGREMLQWDGIDNKAMTVINQTLEKYGYAEKLLPSSPILQLAEMGVRIPNVTEMRTKDDISVYKVESESVRTVLKVFGNQKDAREIENYKLLTSIGVPVLPLLKNTETALLLPDAEYSSEYRLGNEQDLSDTEVARAVAHWYKLLHEKGRKHLSKNKLDLYDETDIITLTNMDFIAKKTDTCSNPLWTAIRKNYDKVKDKIAVLPRTLTYNDFYWTNLVVSQDKTSAMMLDFNLFGRGYAYGDIRNVISSLKGDAKNAFLLEYGSEYTDEAVADAVLSPLVTLYFAGKREMLPAWADESLAELKQGIILDNLKKWLD